MSNFTFDETRHEYRIGDRVLPSVTQILREGGLINGAFYDEDSRERGEYVHRITELYDYGELDESTVDEGLQGYFSAWKRYKKDSGINIQFIEKPCWHETYLYAGTVDRIYELNNKYYILDIKTSKAPQPWWGIQLAAYEPFVRHFISDLIDDDVAGRIAVQLLPDGKYKIRKYGDPGDFSVFLGALAVRNWKYNNNLIRKEKV